MKKIKFWLLLLLIAPVTERAFAQRLEHYFSVNTVCYTNYFNKEHDEAFNRIGKTFIFPSFEYKVMKGNMGIAIYALNWATNYYKLEYGSIKPGEIRGISHQQIGINLQYKLWSRSTTTVTGFIGGTYSDCYALELIQWFGTPPLYESVTNSSIDQTTGLQGGVNLTAEIWKGIYANTNMRLTINPFTNYSLFKQNLAWEIGLGYKLQRKK